MLTPGSTNSGGGGGGVNAGLISQLAYYAAGGTTLSGTYNNPAFGIFNVLQGVGSAPGADPTGVSDSTAAFQNAINAAANSTLYIPPGTYKIVMPAGSSQQYACTIAAPITIVADPNATIIAAAGATNPFFTSASAMFRITGSNVIIDGGIWDQNIANYNALVASDALPYFDTFKVEGVAPTSHVIIKNAKLLNMTVGIEIWNADFVYISECQFDKSALGAVTYRNTGIGPRTNWGVYDCYFAPDPFNQYQMLNFLGDQNGVYPVTYVDIIGNTFNAGDHHTQGGYDNLQLYMNANGATPAYFRQVNCSGNHFIGGQNQFSTVACMNSTFNNNTSEAGFPNVAFCEVGNNFYCTYNGNTFDGTASLSGAGGILGFWETGSPDHVLYSANVIRNVSTHNAIQTTAGRKVITGNMISIDYGAGFTGTGVSCFQEYTNVATNITITGNLFSMGGASLPVSLFDINSATVTGNTFDVETPTYPCVLISSDNTQGGGPYGNIIIDKSNVYVGGLAPVGFSQGGGSTIGPNIQVEYMNADGSTTKFSSGWCSNITPSSAGGTSTQATNKSTALATGTPSLNIYQLDITMNNAALNAGVSVSFDWPNTLIAAGDTVFVNHQSAGTIGAYVLNAVCTSGHCSITVTNRTAGNLSEAIVLRAYLLRGPQI